MLSRGLSLVVLDELFDCLRDQPIHAALGVKASRLRADLLETFDEVPAHADGCQVLWFGVHSLSLAKSVIVSI